MKQKSLSLLLLLMFVFVGCAESQNANLKSFKVSSGTLVPEFEVDENKYELSVNVPVIQITGTTEDPNAVLMIQEENEPYGIILSGQPVEVSLNVGLNKIRFQVVAENGYDFRDYTLSVTR